MEKSLSELWDSLRQGLIDRRDFVTKVALLTGGVAAAGQFTSLSAATHARDGDIIIEEGTYPSGNEKVAYYLARPRSKGPFPTMLVIHEIFGLSDFIREVVHLFAFSGYLAMAPTLLGGGNLPNGKHARWMLDTINTGEAVVIQDEIDKLVDGYAFLAGRKDVDPAYIASVGFCWGGARSFTLATRLADLWAAIVFYGSTPPMDALARIEAPVLGLYGALDNNNATSITGRAAETARMMRSLGKIFEWEVYNRAPHGFFRDGSQVSQSRAALLAWDLLHDFLARHV